MFISFCYCNFIFTLPIFKPTLNKDTNSNSNKGKKNKGSLVVLRKKLKSRSEICNYILKGKKIF